MQALLNAIRTLVAILPAVVDLVKAIERAIPLPRVGAEKLQFLMDIVRAAYEALEEETRKGISLESVMKAAVFLANRVVEIFNKLGWPSSAPTAPRGEPSGEPARG